MSQLQFLKAAHAHSIFNHSEIENSTVCGCFGCLETFSPSTIDRWLEERGGQSATAWCPKCDLDSVIGDASGLPVSDPVFLRSMDEHFCGGEVETND